MSDDCMSDQQQVNAVHDSNGLPAKLAVDFPVLSRQVVWIVEDEAGRLEADTVLSLVDPVFSFVPGKFHNGSCVDEYVYTIAQMSTALHTECTIECQTRPWHPALAHKTRKDGAHGARHGLVASGKILFKPMLLFDAGIRTELGWKTESQSTFAYYDRSARPAMVEFRKMIQGWFNRFPDEDKKDLRERFRSPKEPNHVGAFFEIYLHELFNRLGFELEPHPTIRGCGTHPDYVVSDHGVNQFYLEATLAGLPSQQEQGANTRMGIVYDAINTIESPNFFVRLELKGAPNTAPPTQTLRRDLTGWLASLNPDYILQLHSAGRGSEIPFFPWQHERGSLLFRPVPKSSKLRGQPGVRPLGMRMPEGGWLNTHGEIRKAIENKAKKYGELELPFIIAVN
jgi:hypothetical protein